MAFAAGACSSQASSGAGAAGVGGTTGAGGQVDGAAGTGGRGATGGGDGGRLVHLVTFAFTGHITALVSVDLSGAPYNPAVGDPFTGSYTFNADQIPTPAGEFYEAGPASDVADLEVHTLTGAFPSASAPDGFEQSFIIVSTPTTYVVRITPFAATPAINGLATGLFFFWNLSNPNGMGNPAVELSTVPPDLSAWTQASDAVSIQLFDTSGVDYSVSGVIDTIQAR